MGRRWTAAGVLVLLFVLLPCASARAAAPLDGGAESQFLAATNRERAAGGVDSLSTSNDLVAVARQHAAEMADKGALFHSTDLGSKVSGWRTLGENVGRGTSVDVVQGMFMGSDSHRRNILDGRFTQVGIGVVWSGSTLYVAEVFRQPSAAAPAPAPKPVPAPVRAAMPVAAPPSPPPPPPPPTPVHVDLASPTRALPLDARLTALPPSRPSRAGTDGRRVLATLDVVLIAWVTGRIVRRREWVRPAGEPSHVIT